MSAEDYIVMQGAAELKIERLEAKIKAINEIFNFAEEMSDEGYLLFMECVMIMLNHFEPGNGAGNCHDWVDRLRPDKGENILPDYKNAADFSYTKIRMNNTLKGMLHRPTWVDHAYFEFTNGKGKKLYFDNGGLGTRLHDNDLHFPIWGGRAYGGVFFAEPDWLTPK